jgi:uncharacterized protein
MTAGPVQLLLLAKQPIAGRVKTRLCPPCTPAQAADLAAAALADTIDVLEATPATGRTLVIEGSWPTPPGWRSIPQRGAGLDERLVAAFHDSTLADQAAALLVGMDTPQLTVDLLTQGAAALGDSDAALGLAEDGGWWALALRRPADARLLRGIPTSTALTGAQTLAALRAAGLWVHTLPVLRDVDTAGDALAVAEIMESAGRSGHPAHRDATGPGSIRRARSTPDPLAGSVDAPPRARFPQVARGVLA